MPISSVQVSQLILDQLAGGERRVLSLVVAIGKILQRSGGMKGNLSVIVNSSLRSLLSARMIVEQDGMYSLAASSTGPAAGPSVAGPVMPIVIA